jgi:hypothetical protein
MERRTSAAGSQAYAVRNGPADGSDHDTITCVAVHRMASAGTHSTPSVHKSLAMTGI